MPTIHKTFRIHDWLHDHVMEYSQNKGGISFAKIVEAALKRHLLENDPVTKMTYKTDCQISYIIEYIEKLKNTQGPRLSAKMENTLKNLYETQNLLRENPHYVNLVVPDDFPDNDEL